MQASIMNYPVFMTREQVSEEQKKLWDTVLKSIQYYVLLNYKTTKNLDCYDIEQICLKIARYETYVPEISYLKGKLIEELMEFSANLKQNQITKTEALTKKLREAQTAFFETELEQKEHFLKNLMAFKWPFDKKYNDYSVKYEIQRKQALAIEKQIQSLQAVRAFADYDKVKEFCAKIEQKHFASIK